MFWTIYRFFGGTRTHIIWLVYIFAMHLQDFRFGWVHKYGPKIHVSDTNIYLTKTGLDDLNKYGPSWVSIGKGMSNIVRLADTSSSSWYEIERKSKLIFSRYGGNLPYLVPQTCPTILSPNFWGFRVSNFVDQILWDLSSSAILSSIHVLTLNMCVKYHINIYFNLFQTQVTVSLTKVDFSNLL